MKGLNLVSSIYMGSSIVQVAKGWVGIASGKLLYVASGVKFVYVVNVRS
jgi:hypothetical protein